MVSADFVNRVLLTLNGIKSDAETWVTPPGSDPGDGRDEAIAQAVFARCGRAVLKRLKELEDA
jgi:hypothetical protein